MVFDRDENFTPPPEKSVFEGGKPFFAFGVPDMASKLYRENVAREDASHIAHNALGMVLASRGDDGWEAYQHV